MITFEYLTVPRRQYNPPSAFSRLRPGAKRQHCPLCSLTSLRSRPFPVGKFLPPWQPKVSNDFIFVSRDSRLFDVTKGLGYLHISEHSAW